MLRRSTSSYTRSASRFFFQAEDGIRDGHVTGVQTCALPIFSLGDECVIEAGLYVTAGTKVAFEGRTVKAESLSGEDGLLFRRNSTTGKVEALRRSGEALALNAALHT